MEETTSDPKISRAPWTAEQVESLNGYQKADIMHPFTCGGDHPLDLVKWEAGEFLDTDLVATPAGWVCPVAGCGYTQDWAHAFMADGSWRRAVEARDAMFARARANVEIGTEREGDVEA